MTGQIESQLQYILEDGTYHFSMQEFVVTAGLSTWSLHS